MYHRTGEVLERQLPCDAEDTEEEIDDLEDGYRLDSAIEVLGNEVPENLRPEEALYRGGDLVCQQLAKATIRQVVTLGSCNSHIDAVIMISRAQWFLMSLPISTIYLYRMAVYAPRRNDAWLDDASSK